MDHQDFLRQLQGAKAFSGKMIAFKSIEQKNRFIKKCTNREEWENLMVPAPTTIRRTVSGHSSDFVIYPVWCCVGLTSQNPVNRTRYLAIVFWKSRREIWLYDPVTKENKNPRTWPPSMKRACEAYDSWTKYAMHGTPEEGKNGAQSVINFIKSFPENTDKYEKTEIISFN